MLHKKQRATNDKADMEKLAAAVQAQRAARARLTAILPDRVLIRLIPHNVKRKEGEFSNKH